MHSKISRPAAHSTVTIHLESGVDHRKQDSANTLRTVRLDRFRVSQFVPEASHRISDKT